MNDASRQQFEDKGYMLVPGVIGQTTVKALRDFLLPQFEKEKTNVLSDAVIRFPQILDVLKTPKLLEVLGELLGRPFVVPPHSSAEHNRFGVFHADTTGAEISGETFHRDPNYRMVTVAIYLQDNNEYGGGIRLAPGTHSKLDPYVELTKRKAKIREKFNRSPLQQMLKRLTRGKLYDWDKPFRDHPYGEDIPTKAGDALIWDMRIAHRASPQLVKAQKGGGKISVFFTAGANNDVTKKDYVKYVYSVLGNAHLKKTRSSAEVAIPPANSDFIIL